MTPGEIADELERLRELRGQNEDIIRKAQQNAKEIDGMIARREAMLAEQPAEGDRS